MPKPFRFFYLFSKGQQKGILALFVMVVIFQIAYFVFNAIDFTTEKERSADEKQWLSLQSKIDALKAKKKEHKDTIYPFNPNYITDYKGYILGLSTKELDKIYAYRKTDSFMNSPEDFKKVTGIHDTLLARLSPYLKFSSKPVYASSDKSDKQNFDKENRVIKAGKVVKALDINVALEEDLVKVYGIGPYYAKEILRRRAMLGAFVSMDQMDDFIAISPEAKAGLKKSFKVTTQPDVEKINVNTASLLQLSRFAYFNRDIARSIITERSMNGELHKIDDLLKISGFPVDKVKIIALYLEF